MSCFDPLSSQGILKALRSGIFASYAIVDRLLHADDGHGCARYAALIRQGVQGVPDHPACVLPSRTTLVRGTVLVPSAHSERQRWVRQGAT